MCRKIPNLVFDTKTAQATNPLGTGATCDCGFSILELVLVLAIMTTVAAMAAPRYAAPTARYRADLAARRIAHDLELARATAKAKGATQKTRLRHSSHEVQLYDAAALDPHMPTYLTHLSDSPYFADITSSDFGGDNKVIFDGWGLPDSGGAAVLTVGSETRTITVDPNTGKASIQ